MGVSTTFKVNTAFQSHKRAVVKEAIRELGSAFHDFWF
jgi:hypothetical protein